MSATLHVLRVFCAANGTGGNPLGVFADGRDVPESQRQRVAADLGFAETVFIDDRVENVAAARAAGLKGIHHTSAEDLRVRLWALGVL